MPSGTEHFPGEPLLSENFILATNGVLVYFLRPLLNTTEWATYKWACVAQ